MLASLPAAARLTLTWDQGSEMAHHDRLADLFAGGIFFAHPGSPWPRGTNGNTDGLLRQYFPKGGDLRDFDANDLRDVEQRLNHRPRKILGWQTPAQVFASAVTPSPPRRCDGRSNPPLESTRRQGSTVSGRRQRHHRVGDVGHDAVRRRRAHLPDARRRPERRRFSAVWAAATDSQPRGLPRRHR